MQEIGRFECKNKFYTKWIRKILIFMQCMNSSLGSLVKNMSDNNFKHISQKFSSECLKLVKQKGVHPWVYIWTVSKSSLMIHSLTDMIFFSSSKDKCISEKDYMHAIHVRNMFKMKTMGDYHDLYLKADVCY